MTDGEFSRTTAYQFLAEIKKRFLATYGERAKTALAFAFNADFERVLQAQMDHFNNAKGNDKISKVNEEISQVKNVMIQNIGMSFTAYFLFLSHFFSSSQPVPLV